MDRARACAVPTVLGSQVARRNASVWVGLAAASCVLLLHGLGWSDGLFLGEMEVFGKKNLVRGLRAGGGIMCKECKIFKGQACM
jgi:hypothetical protein